MAHWGRQRVIGVGKLPAPMRGFLPQWDRWARIVGPGPLVPTAGFGPLGPGGRRTGGGAGGRRMIPNGRGPGRRWARRPSPRSD
ncbi:hypothetical protein HMPREF1550_02379 [Actinomyces sp. oral taxon 877 str. F0543]|nr:hypothetical protein HMPREF1550_02379 [Actinomyces sp. oral taxon 877 str. F0543]